MSTSTTTTDSTDEYEVAYNAWLHACDELADAAACLVAATSQGFCDHHSRDLRNKMTEGRRRLERALRAVAENPYPGLKPCWWELHTSQPSQYDSAHWALVASREADRQT